MHIKYLVGTENCSTWARKADYQFISMSIKSIWSSSRNLLGLINSIVLLTEIGEELHKTEKAQMAKYTWRKIDETERKRAQVKTETKGTDTWVIVPVSSQYYFHNHEW